MLINTKEYQAMFEVEDQMWWYKNLHEQVLEEIKKNSPNYKSLKILDAGCGTGGMLTKLLEAGISDIKGFDFNDDAVAFSSMRGLPVKKLSITSCNTYYPKASFDIIISNDVLYQFDNQEIKQILKNLEELLKPGGIIISNNNAFKIFGGTHDIAVGSKRRFTKADFTNFLKDTPSLQIKKSTYWPMFLTPVVLLVRLFQKLQIKLGWVDSKSLKSDVSIPPKIFNSLLYYICRLERTLFHKGIFGSSLLLICKKSYK